METEVLSESDILSETVSREASEGTTAISLTNTQTPVSQNGR